jgi:hypothetical protein
MKGIPVRIVIVFSRTTLREIRQGKYAPATIATAHLC